MEGVGLSSVWVCMCVCESGCRGHGSVMCVCGCVRMCNVCERVCACIGIGIGRSADVNLQFSNLLMLRDLKCICL